MSSNKIICPVCGQSDQVEKVSTIYLEGIRVNRLRFSKNSEGVSLPPSRQRLLKIPVQDLYSLSRKLAPPSSRKTMPTRPLHPDMVVIVFSGIVPIFLFGILNQQRSLFIPALIILVCFYGLYFYKREAVIAKYEHEKATKQEAQTRIERGIESWMRLYYCARDEGVFLPDERELIPVDRMIGYLLHRPS